MERPLGGFEHALWLYDHVHPIHFSVAARIRGAFGLEQLRGALRGVQRQHPLLRVRVEADAGSRPRFVEENADIPFRVIAREDDLQLEHELETELVQSFDWSRAPLARVALLHSESVSELIVTLAHPLADGMSGAFVIRDIVRGLAGERVTARMLADCPPIELAAPDAFRVKEGAARESSVSLDTMPVMASVRVRPHVRTTLLSAESTRRLCERSRDEHTTVHAAICAAFLLTLSRQQGRSSSSALKCLSPIDVRSHLSPAVRETAGLFICFGMTHHDLTVDTPLWDVARSLKSQLSATRTPEQLFGILAPRHAMMAMCPDAGLVVQGMQQQYDNDVLITNLGQLNIEQQVGGLRIDAMYGPSIMTGIPNERVVGVITLGERMSLTLATAASEDTDSNAAATLAEAVHRLGEAVQSPAASARLAASVT